jgi:hypothetical protein
VREREGGGLGQVPRGVGGGAGQPKAKAQAAGLKIGDGPKLKKKFLSNFI